MADPRRPPLHPVGTSTLRHDGADKTTGTFTYSNDLHAEGMLHGATLRSPHPHARILSIDTEPARAIPGVHAVLSAWDVPDFLFGLVQRDEYVLAHDVVRYVGEPVAIVAAEDLVTAQRACAAIEVVYEPLPPVTDPLRGLTAEPIHPDGNLIRHVHFTAGDPAARGPVSVEAEYVIGRQDHAFLAPEAGLARPDGHGGVELHVATQWLHSDRNQIAVSLGLPIERVVLVQSGVGGAFGGREDVTIQIHACLLALAAQRPVKVALSRQESFLMHRQRHPGRVWVRTDAEHDGTLVSIEARIVLDAGAYASTSGPVLLNTATFMQGPYRVPNGRVDAWAVRTNNPSSGAFRGFGNPQASYVHEAQMDRLAQALGMDPVQLRLHNALRQGDRLMFGQLLDRPTPVAEVIERCAAMALPDDDAPGDPLVHLPGGVGRAGDRRHVRRGVGFAAVMKNTAFSESTPDDSTAMVHLKDGVVTVRCAAVEVGQGFVTVARQIARTILTVDDVTIETADTLIASAGSTSASRQTQTSGSAVAVASAAVKERYLRFVARRRGHEAGSLDLRDGWVVDADGRRVCTVAEGGEGRFFQATERWENRRTRTLAGEPHPELPVHVAIGYSAQRAVVDVDLELGLVKVVQINACQDAGTVVNPLALEGQVEGGAVQGMGLAVMEDFQVVDGQPMNPDFDFYLIPTIVDAPAVRVELVDDPEPGIPLGLKGAAEIPLVNALPAVAAAVRDATGLELRAVPIEPQHIALGEAVAPVESVLEATLDLAERSPGSWSAGDLASTREDPPWGAF
jgi:xanthine dehydrogenase D subunit